MSKPAEVYATQLSCFKYGHPMWWPEPCANLDGTVHDVQIGDVGYIDGDGGFHRILNITYDHAHPLNSAGVLDGFEPLKYDRRSRDTKAGFLNPGPVCSRSVKSRSIEGNASGGAMGTAGGGISYRFECSSRAGAMLVLKDHATKSSLVLDGLFKAYMIQNHKRWHDFAISLGVDCRPQDIVLIRGTVKTTSWAVAAVFDAGQQVHEVTFDGRFGNLASIGAKHSTELNTMCSFQQRVGPYTPAAAGQPPPCPADLVSRPADQSIFLSYFKIKYRPFIPKKIIANAEDSEYLPDNDACSDHNIMVSSTASEVETETPDDMPPNPIDDILDYILERSDAQRAIASHADLEHIAMDSNDDISILALLRQQLPAIEVDGAMSGSLQNDARNNTSVSSASDHGPSIGVHGLVAEEEAPQGESPLQQTGFEPDITQMMKRFSYVEVDDSDHRSSLATAVVDEPIKETEGRVLTLTPTPGVFRASIARRKASPL